MSNSSVNTNSEYDHELWKHIFTLPYDLQYIIHKKLLENNAEHAFRGILYVDKIIRDNTYPNCELPHDMYLSSQYYDSYYNDMRNNVKNEYNVIRDPRSRRFFQLDTNSNLVSKLELLYSKKNGNITMDEVEEHIDGFKAIYPNKPDDAEIARMQREVFNIHNRPPLRDNPYSSSNPYPKELLEYKIGDDVVIPKYRELSKNIFNKKTSNKDTGKINRELNAIALAIECVPNDKNALYHIVEKDLQDSKITHGRLAKINEPIYNKINIRRKKLINKQLRQEANGFVSLTYDDINEKMDNFIKSTPITKLKLPSLTHRFNSKYLDTINSNIINSNTTDSNIIVPQRIESIKSIDFLSDTPNILDGKNVCINPNILISNRYVDTSNYEQFD